MSTETILANKPAAIDGLPAERRGWAAAAIFTALAMFGVTAAFETPASSAMLTAVAPAGLLQKATALSSGVYQVAAISGPASLRYWHMWMWPLSPGAGAQRCTNRKTPSHCS